MIGIGIPISHSNPPLNIVASLYGEVSTPGDRTGFRSRARDQTLSNDQSWSRWSVISRAPRWKVAKSHTHLNATAMRLRAPIRK